VIWLGLLAFSGPTLMVALVWLVDSGRRLEPVACDTEPWHD
jgi:hypothetical protein